MLWNVSFPVHSLNWRMWHWKRTLHSMELIGENINIWAFLRLTSSWIFTWKWLTDLLSLFEWFLFPLKIISSGSHILNTSLVNEVTHSVIKLSSFLRSSVISLLTPALLLPFLHFNAHQRCSRLYILEPRGLISPLHQSSCFQWFVWLHQINENICRSVLSWRF